MNGKGHFDHHDEAVIIDMVRKHPSLWNQSDKYYQKKGLKKLLYTQIADDLKKMWPDKAHLLSADVVRLKFNMLKSYFVKEKRKMKACDKDSFIKPFPTWIHFDRLLFVSEKDDDIETECDLNISTEGVEEEISNDDREMVLSDSIGDISCSDSSEGKDSFLLQSSIQSNKEAFRPSGKIEIPDDSPRCSDVNIDSSIMMHSLVQPNDEVFKPSVKIEVPDDPSPEAVSFMTENSDREVHEEASFSFRNEGTNSTLFLQPSVQSNEEDGEPVLKKKNTTDLSPTHVSLNIRTPVNSVFAEAIYSDINEDTNSTPPLQPSVLLNNEGVVSALKEKNLSNSSPVCDSTETETPLPVISEISWPSSTLNSERTNSFPPLQPPVQTNEQTSGLPLKGKKLLLLHRIPPHFRDRRPLLMNKKKKLNNSSPMCDSTEKKSPVVFNTWSSHPLAPPPFHVNLGNLVASSLNQMPADKANSATKAILDILLKYGKETNHPR